MTAPSASLGGPLHYQHGGYGPMFSPATYNGAGFPANFGGARHVAYGAARQGLSNVPENVQQRPPGTAGSTADLFAHQPPPLASTSASAAYPHHYAGYQRPGTDHNIRREDHYRPGTSDTMRPDTAISTFSDYSATGFGHPPGLSAAMGGNANAMQPMAIHQQHAAGGAHPAYYNVAQHSAGLLNGHHAVYAHHQQQATHPYHLHQYGAGHDDQNPGADKYSFVPLPSQPKKRPRRRFEEIERIYDCNYPGCNKAYGTLNHLNAHVSMQKHGPKRVPAEFKEIRKAWRQRKKENEARAAAAEARGEADDGDEAEDDQNESGELGCHHQQYKRDGEQHIPSLPPDLKYQVNPYSVKAGGGSQSTPPGSTQLPSSPSFAFYPPYGLSQHHHQLNGMAGTHSSDGYYYYSAHGGQQQQQQHGARPSTAPGTFLYNAYGPGTSSYPNSANGTPAIGTAAAPGGGTPPMVASMPAGFNPAMRKQSITSLPPPFASIQEEPAGEAAAAEEPLGLDGNDPNRDGLTASAFAGLGDKGIGEIDGFASELLDPFAAAGSHSGLGRNDITPSPIQARSLPNQSDTVFAFPPFAGDVTIQQQQQQQVGSPSSVHSGDQRPSTASSPFRFSTGGFAEGAYDTLGRRRKSIASPLSVGVNGASFTGVGEVNLGNGLAAPGLAVATSRSDNSGTPNSGVDITGRWSPGWNNLASYKQEIR